MPQKKHRNRAGKEVKKYGYHMSLEKLISGKDLQFLPNGTLVQYFTKAYKRVNGKMVAVNILKHPDWIGAMKTVRKSMIDPNDRVIVYDAHRRMVSVYSFKPKRTKKPIVQRTIKVNEPRNKTTRRIYHVTYTMPLTAEKLAAKLLKEPLPCVDEHGLPVYGGFAIRISPQGDWILHQLDWERHKSSYGKAF